MPPLLLESLFYINQTMGNYLSKVDLSKVPLKLGEAVPLSHKIIQNWIQEKKDSIEFEFIEYQQHYSYHRESILIHIACCGSAKSQFRFIFQHVYCGRHNRWIHSPVFSSPHFLAFLRYRGWGKNFLKLHVLSPISSPCSEETS